MDVLLPVVWRAVESRAWSPPWMPVPVPVPWLAAVPPGHRVTAGLALPLQHLPQPGSTRSVWQRPPQRGHLLTGRGVPRWKQRKMNLLPSLLCSASFNQKWISCWETGKINATFPLALHGALGWKVLQKCSSFGSPCFRSTGNCPD